MVVERRAFNRLPEFLRTDQNNRDMYISDDVMFEPERAGFISGYIGDVSLLTEIDLERKPQLVEGTDERQKYQLSLGAVIVDPDTDDRSGGAFYTDLLGQIDSNGGLTNDPNRLFETPFYAWTPPIDYDKHINFSRYFWTGDGNAEVNGEYVTKEPQGSQTVVYELVSGTFVGRTATISDAAPTSPTVGDVWEDSDDPSRLVYRWDGTSWIAIVFSVQTDIPTDTSSYNEGDFIYVTRTGPAHNRPLVWMYSDGAGRWISKPVVVGPTPTSPVAGMIWEDATVSPTRILRIYQNENFVTLPYTTSAGPTGTATDQTYVYDTRDLSEITDTWSVQNWWRHFDDLSGADRDALETNESAVRPILEFWAGIQPADADVRDSRNDTPFFKVYRYDTTTSELVDAVHNTTLFQYQVGTGTDDTVLGFPVTFNNTGEFTFELTLETDTVASATGYRYFVDTFTGLAHSIWSKAPDSTVQLVDENDLADVPKSITSNADHDILTTASRSQFIQHMTGNIQSQTGFAGDALGPNTYRWTDKDTTVGATIIDCENSLLRAMGTLQRSDLGIPDTIRRMGREYQRVMFKFTNRLNVLWENLTISNPDDTLSVTATQAVDTIMTDLFIGRNASFPFYYSDMGTYTETQIAGGVVSTIGTDPRPIFIPPSPAKIGAIQTYTPGTFTDRNGTNRLRGHDGTLINSFGDERDLVWIELQNRFYTAVASYYKDETTTFSSRHGTSTFFLDDFYGNSTPTITETIDQVTTDYTAITSPTTGTVVADSTRAETAYYDGSNWLTKPILVDDILFNRTDGEYYIYNGFGVFLIDRFNRSFTFDYTDEEFKLVLRREFERWAVFQDVDFVTNTEYDVNDPFTWNYTSAGVEGHYMGIYKRLYRTVRPHSHPWEIVGYSSRPDWWLTSYVPTSTAADGTPRYASTHAMWTDIQAGIYNPLTSLQSTQFAMTGPIPVDVSGELIDPIAAGIVNEDKLVPERRDDGWIYGDGSPGEQLFLESTNYTFALALVGYLMKPGRYVDTLWSQLYIDVGTTGTYPVYRAPHIVHIDTLTRPGLDDLPVHLETVNNVVQQRIGLNAWISEYTQILGNDVTATFGDTIRNTEISLGWSCAGFVNQNRSVVRTLGGTQVPFEDVHTVLHRSTPREEYFGSGVLITREGTGYKVFGFDLFDPFFEIDVPVNPIVGGQVELREEFTATASQHSYTVTQFNLPQNAENSDTAQFAVLINGLKLNNQHVTVTSKTTFDIEDIVTINAGDVVSVVIITTQSNASTRVKQFRVEGVSFPYIDSGQGVTQRIEYGRYFDTAPDVINFLLGYGRQLEKQGWVFDQEVTTGVVRDWLYGAKAFATWILETTSPWQPDGPTDSTTFYYSPFSRLSKFTSSFGQVLNIEALQNGAYGIVDQEANPIDPNAVFTSRIGNTITLQPDDDTADIYGVRVLVAIDQHVVFFSNVTKFNDLLYNPVISLAQSALLVDSYRTQNWNGRLEADGFVINDGELLPNFEKQAFDITRFYDRINTLDDPVKREQARELYGWYPNDTYTAPDGEQTLMMGAIGADDRSQFDYHRGMLHTKGTIRPIIAFSRGTRIGQDNVRVSEDWAWRWCEFGDLRRTLVQFGVSQNDFKDQLQLIEFNAVDNATDTALQIAQFDRSTPNTGPWILPPSTGDDSQCCPYYLPVDATTNLFDPAGTEMLVKLFDTDTNITAVRMFHFDPAISSRLTDPEAFCQIDYDGKADPARYTDGTGAAYSEGIQWGSDQVGQIWWDHDRATYTDYHSYVTTDVNRATQEWGKLQYFNATVTRTDNMVTVTTLDPFTNAAVAHNLTTGDVVEISGANQTDYNTEVTVTVTSVSTFEYEILTVPDTPATGNIIVKTGFVDIHEWIESPVVPSGWANYIATLTDTGSPTGVPINGDDTSYVTQTITNDSGVSTTRYYFWIRGNSGDNSVKDYTSTQIASRIEFPTINNIAWFAPIDRTHLLVFVNGEQVQDDYAIEITQDDRNLDNHAEWVLVSEGDQFNDFPAVVSDKIKDSLSGQDTNGNAVPATTLATSELYGTETFPPQTIFSDRASALTVFVTAANTILARKNLTEVNENVAGLFPTTAENTYWSKGNYRSQTYETNSVFDTVATEAIRDARLVEKRYVNGDLVTITQSANTDLWTSATTASTYALVDGAFIEVGVDNVTLQIALDTTTDAATIRTVFDNVLQLLEKSEINDLMFSVLYEMTRQDPDIDWFMKTSYITLQAFETLSNSPFVRPSEVDAIIANALDMKPYRTKLRTSTFTYTVDSVENADISLTEFPDKKVTLLFDRLNCELEDEAGWDRFPFDTEQFGWDKPIWDFSGQGTTEYYSLGEVPVVAGQTVYTFDTIHDPMLYEHTLTVRDGGTVFDIANIGITSTITKNHSQVIVTLSDSLSVNYTLEVMQSSGFYMGTAPTLGPSFADTLFQPYESTFKHHVARMLEAGTQAPFPSMDECYLTPPQSPQERLPNDVEDSVVIKVQTDWTGAYAGWDTTPWDTTGFDETPTNIGSLTFFQSIGAETTIAAGNASIPTSETVVVVDTTFVARTNTTSPTGRVDLNGVTLTEGTDYEYLTDVPWVIRMLPRADITYTADGAATTFDISSATYGISGVYLNGNLLTDGIQYNIVGNDVVFVQPAPSTQAINSTSLGRHYTSTTATLSSFDTGHTGNSLNVANGFVFVDGDLLPTADYTVDVASSSYVTTTPVGLGDDVIVTSWGNSAADNDDIFEEVILAGDGVTTSFAVGFDADLETSWIFVDGRYQVLGADYTHSAAGTVDFTVAPAVAAVINVRILRPADYVSYDLEHVVFTSSGAATDAIPGISDASPDRMIVFVDDQIQNIYSGLVADFTITNGTPDIINWTVTPPIGSRITVRMVRSIQIDQITNILVEPNAGDEIRITQNDTLSLGDNMTFYYTQFSLGPLSTYTVTSVPATYDIDSTGVMTLDAEVLGGTIDITYTADRRGPSDSALLVRMANIVDHAGTDHTVWTDVQTLNQHFYVGMRFLNTTDDTVYQWDGSAWVAQADTFVNTDQVMVLIDQNILQFDGATWTTIYTLGDTYTKPPVLDYPTFGLGIVSGTYALGQLADAATFFPDAYQVVQHPGAY